MALATRCPACGTVFRISTAQATAKGGRVRCGQCRNVFDSLDALVRVEDLEVIEEVQVAPHDDAAVVATPSSGTAAVATAAGEPAASDVDPRDPSLPPPVRVEAEEAALADSTETASIDVAPTGIVSLGAASTAVESTTPATDPEAEHAGRDPQAATGAESTGVDPVAATRDVPVDQQAPGEWWLPDPKDPTAARADASPVSEHASEFGSGPTTGRQDASRSLRGRHTDLQAANAVDRDPSFMVGAPSTRLGRTARWLLGLLSSIAAFGLAAQLTYLWRDEIAVHWAPARPWLVAACESLRCKVGYPEHLASITIESATIQTTGTNPGVYMLNALLRNRDASVVRYPQLELVLTDLQDRPILRRALRPQDYLPPGLTTGAPPMRVVDGDAQTGFPAQSELPVRMVFELGDLHFSGYRLDRYYP